MKIRDTPFGTTDWSAVARTEHRGERGEHGMSYQVAYGAQAHRSSTTPGAKLFIVD